MLLLAASSAGAACGDGVRDGTEACDGADFGGATCFDLTGGFVRGGTLVCNADCTINTDDCRRAFVESLVPAKGGQVKNRCQLEWTGVGTTQSGPATRRICTDGDGECDDDHSFNSSCTFRLQVCLNVPDPKVPGCAFMTEPGKVFRVQVMAPKATVSPAVVESLLDAAEDLGRGAGVATSRGSDGASVAFSPPITDFQCGQATLNVPLKGTAGRARPGKLKLRARSSDNSGKIKANGALTLVCNP
ncbi:MAG TPA: hypothetical protein VKA21_06285 [Candidatus Binatia bacterium]|nr:hypothetical protein [Candidatus Binatia bacterium]